MIVTSYSTILGSYYSFFTDTATTEIYTFSLHDALPIWNALWTLAPADQVLRTKLRDYLGLTRPALDQDKDKDSVTSLLAAVIEAVYGSVNIPGFDAAVLISIRAKIPPTLDAAGLVK